MTDEQVKRVLDEMMDRMFADVAREEREIERLMQEQNKESDDDNDT